MQPVNCFDGFALLKWTRMRGGTLRFFRKLLPEQRRARLLAQVAFSMTSPIQFLLRLRHMGGTVQGKNRIGKSCLYGEINERGMEKWTH